MPPPEAPPVADRAAPQPDASTTRGAAPPPRAAQAETYTGDYSIIGSIWTATGAPVAGVRVLGYPRHAGAPDLGTQRGETFDAYVRRVAAAWREAGGFVVEATSDWSGRFELRGLAFMPWVVVPDAPAYRFQSSTARDFTRVEPDIRVHVGFAVGGGPGVMIDVRMPDGSPAPRAEIRVRTEGDDGDVGTHVYEWEAGTPPLPLRLGVHFLTASLELPDGSGRLVSEPGGVELFADAPVLPVTVTLTLARVPGIRGTVAFPSDEVNSEGIVRLLRLDAGATADERRLKREGDVAFVNARAPTFAFDDIPPGRYAIGGARHFGDAVHGLAEVSVRDSSVVHDIAIPPLASEEHWIVRVLGPTGELVTDCDRFGIWPTAHEGRGFYPTAVTRKVDGSWWLLRERAESAPNAPPEDTAGPFVLRVRSESLGETAVPLPQGGDHRVEVRFQAPASLVVSVTGWEPAMAERVELLVLRHAEPAPRLALDQHPVVQPDPEGSERVGPLAPGAYDLVVVARMSEHTRMEAARHPIDLHVGTNTATVPAPAIHSVDIVVPEPESVARIGIVPIGAVGDARRPHDIELDEAGAATLPNVGAGRYRILVGRRWGALETMGIRVPVDRRVAFVAESITAVRVIITDPRGTLGLYGLKDGDLIVAIDDRDFTDLETMQALFAAGVEKGGLMLSVLRGNERRRAPLPASALEDPTRMGGVLEPESR